MFEVTIVDSDGRTYSRQWKDTANKLDAIRWTVESWDVCYSVEVDKITEVKISNNIQ